MSANQAQTSASSSSGITLYEGDLFASAPQCSVLVHACNTQGSWSSGIAAIFRKKYPDAYEVYHQVCLEKGDELLGTCLLIPTGERDIACLFTSKKYGKYVDSKDMILASTKTATQDLLKQLEGSDKPIYGWYVSASTSCIRIYSDTGVILVELMRVCLGCLGKRR